MAIRQKSTEPFFLKGNGVRGEIALMMVHGFTGSPSEFRRMGKYFNDLGYTVYAFRLAGHGTTPEEMLKTDKDDWYRSVLDAYSYLKNRGYRKIVLIGHSMGGLLSLKCAAERKVLAVITLCALIYQKDRRAIFSGFLQYFRRYVKRGGPDPEHIASEICHYDRTPLACVASLMKLVREMKPQLRKVTAPILIAQSEQDRTVRPKSAKYIFDHVSSRFKQIRYYSRSGHIIQVDHDWRELYRDCDEFLRLFDGQGLTGSDLVNTNNKI